MNRIRHRLTHEVTIRRFRQHLAHVEAVAAFWAATDDTDG